MGLFCLLGLLVLWLCSRGEFFACGAWLFAYGVGLFLFCFLVCWRCRFGCLPSALASPCFHVGLFVLPLCGAALTFFAAAKKVSKESGSHRQCLGVLLVCIFGVVRARSDLPHRPRS
jgi:hypothetical protein